MGQPLVDITIAVHSAERLIARAVGSVLEHTTAPVRVNVVAHNIDPSIIRARLGAYAKDDRLRLLHLADGIGSPAGPFNLGLAESDAAFTSIMGSDDELAPGAVDSWLRLQASSGSAAVIARIYHEGRGFDGYPPVRPGRQVGLDAVKDRLAYRSAPLGLVSRQHFGHLRFTEGLPSGEDLAYVNQIWFSGQPIAFDRYGPAYIGHGDANDRVTHSSRSVADDFAYLSEIIDAPWYRDLALASRQALAVKLIRLHVFDALLSRADTAPLADAVRSELGEVVFRIVASAPGVDRLLSRIDHKVLNTLLAHGVSKQDFTELLAKRWNYRSAAAMLPANTWYLFHRQAPFRTLLAGLVVTKDRSRRRP